jgi:hypothetical protein
VRILEGEPHLRRLEGPGGFGFSAHHHDAGGRAHDGGDLGEKGLLIAGLAHGLGGDDEGNAGLFAADFVTELAERGQRVAAGLGGEGTAGHKTAPETCRNRI